MERVETQWLAIICLCLGTLFICLKGEVIYIALILAAVILMSLGLMELVSHKTISGLIKFGIGVVAALFAWVPALSSVSFYLLASLLILLGIYEIILANKNGLKGKPALYLLSTLIIPVLCIVAGVMMFFNKPWVFIAIGVLLLVAGLLNFCQVCIKSSKK